jgi:hypothetical protein
MGVTLRRKSKIGGEDGLLLAIVQINKKRDVGVQRNGSCKFGEFAERMWMIFSSGKKKWARPDLQRKMI